MEQFLENNFSKAFAIAWSENQGKYSENIAKNTLNFIEKQGLQVNSVLDICCGSANFLGAMEKSGKKCTGTEILDSYIEYDKAKYENIEFVKTETILDFDSLGKYDLISCNHDMVNQLQGIDKWETFFQKAYNHLNNGGILIFDYYTKKKLENWNEIDYDENEKLDYIKNIESDGESKTTISNIYYININPKINENLQEKQYGMNYHENKYKKTEDISVEYYYENDDILSAIKRSGYRYLITTDGNFNPVTAIFDMNRIHVIAIKREQ